MKILQAVYCLLYETLKAEAASDTRAPGKIILRIYRNPPDGQPVAVFETRSSWS